MHNTQGLVNDDPDDLFNENDDPMMTLMTLMTFFKNLIIRRTYSERKMMTFWEKGQKKGKKGLFFMGSPPTTPP